MMWRNMHVYVNRENMQRARYILYPPQQSILNTIYSTGYNDALRFINNKRLS